MRKPPLLPSEALRKVLRIARFDGTIVLVVAAAFALGSASTHDPMGTLIGLLIAGAGAMELHGAGQIHHGDRRGLNWLIGGQFYLMAIILAYVGYNLRHVDIEPLRSIITTENRDQILQAGFTVDDFLRLIYMTGCYALALLTVVYQSGMVIYYRSRRRAIAEALREHEVE